MGNDCSADRRRRAGSARSAATVPKQFAPLAGMPMLAHSFAALSSHPAIDSVVVVIGEGQEAALDAALGQVSFVIGGATRRESVANGLAAIDAERVLIHDAARPFLPHAVIDRLLAALDSHEGAVPALPVADTLAQGGEALGDTVPRDGLVRVQTPQAFRTATILAAHRAWPAERGDRRRADGPRARTHGRDGRRRHRCSKRSPIPPTSPPPRHGMPPRCASAPRRAIDVHRFAEGEELWLGGVLIPHDKGLSGHSDADVALHAITDALLGTIAAGDIGMHFPPSDPQWRGAASAQFLEHAASLLAAQGGVIDFVDLTIICEAPKIGPHRDSIRANIAAILRLPIARISVKATTTERLGFTGRGEGIAAQAIATVRLPADNA